MLIYYNSMIMKQGSCKDHRSIFCAAAIKIYHDSALFQEVWQLVLEQVCSVSMSFVLVLGLLWSFLISDYLLPQKDPVSTTSKMTIPQ